MTEESYYTKYNAYWDEGKNDWVEYEVANPPRAIRFPFWVFRSSYDIFIRPITRMFS